VIPFPLITILRPRMTCGDLLSANPMFLSRHVRGNVYACIILRTFRASSRKTHFSPPLLARILTAPGFIHPRPTPVSQLQPVFDARVGPY
jgi:hypothetical protein